MKFDRIVKDSTDAFTNEMKAKIGKYPNGKASTEDIIVEVGKSLATFSADLLRRYHAALSAELAERGIILNDSD